MPLTSPEAFLETYGRVSLLNRSILEKLKVILESFHRRGIEVLLLKGADLLSRPGAFRGLRPMQDVDLLIHEKDIPAIDECLWPLGYKARLDGNLVCEDSERTYTLDMLTEIWYFENLEDLWRRARDRSCLGAPCKGMSPEDLVVYLTAYVTVHRGFLNPIYAQDLSVILEAEAIDWTLVRKYLLQFNLKIPGYHGFRYAVARGTKIPAEVIANLTPATREERRLGFLFQRLVTETMIPQIGHFLLWITQPKAKRGSWLEKMFFPSPAKMHYRYGVDFEGGHWGIRMGRIFSLIVKAAVLLVKMGRALCRNDMRKAGELRECS